MDTFATLGTLICYVNAKRSGSLSYTVCCLLSACVYVCVHVGAPVMFDDGVRSNRSVSLLLAMMDCRFNLSYVALITSIRHFLSLHCCVTFAKAKFVRSQPSSLSLLALNTEMGDRRRYAKEKTIFRDITQGKYL